MKVHPVLFMIMFSVCDPFMVYDLWFMVYPCSELCLPPNYNILQGDHANHSHYIQIHVHISTCVCVCVCVLGCILLVPDKHA